MEWGGRIFFPLALLVSFAWFLSQRALWNKASYGSQWKDHTDKIKDQRISCLGMWAAWIDCWVFATAYQQFIQFWKKIWGFWLPHAMDKFTATAASQVLTPLYPRVNHLILFSKQHFTRWCWEKKMKRQTEETEIQNRRVLNFCLSHVILTHLPAKNSRHHMRHPGRSAVATRVRRYHWQWREHGRCHC